MSEPLYNTEDQDETVENRFEIIFLYDVEEGNPNGDPVNENRPRIDEETDRNLVTDVRLKRTVRDYFIDQYEGDTEKVFIRQIRDEDSYLKDREALAKDAVGEDVLEDLECQERKEKITDELLNQFIDLRLFGATLSFDDAPASFTGPVQFKLGKSMHKVDDRYIRNSVVLPGGEKKKQGTFGDRYVLPYSLINFYGIVNENAAENTGLSRSDVYKLADGIWNGTKSLITHSKMTHKPQALITVEYSEENYHIGGIDGLVDAKPVEGKDEKEIRSFSDIELDTGELNEKLKDKSDKISAVHIQSEFEIELPESIEKQELDLE
jgi:CRISPR-associated protein Csh2